MDILWIFFILVFFCIYVLLGLYITEDINSSIQVLLAWVIYTIMCATFLNVFLIGYFWSVIQNKKGPTGHRGPSGETGTIGIQGTCSIDATEAFLIKALTDYIDALYHSKTNTHIMNNNYKFTNNFLNNKISQTAGSRQYKVLVANLSKDKKPVINLINYLKSIWKQWFDLIFDATGTQGSWFTDEFGNDIDDYGWVGINPFIEIRKYDVYYWGITRNFRPLKAEICRSTINHVDDKFPQPQKFPVTKDTQAEPRLKIIETNDYYSVRYMGTSGDDYTDASNFWSPNPATIDNETYYPIGDILTADTYRITKTGKTIVGNNEYVTMAENGPDMKSILIAGDIVDPIGYDRRRDTGGSGGEKMQIAVPVCPAGYKALGNVLQSVENDYNKLTKCVPEECLEVNQPHNGGTKRWYKHHKWFDWSWFPGWAYIWDYDVHTISDWHTNPAPAHDNSYNIFKLPEQPEPYYKLKKECLEKTPNVDFPEVIKPIPIPPLTKEVESEYADLGIGWYGHPNKLDPKYSIFSYLHLIPEGIIVNQGTGERLYIVHNEGNDINLFNILTYNKDTAKYDGALQANNYNKNGTGFKIEPIVVQDDSLGNIIDQNESTMNEVVNYGASIDIKNSNAKTQNTPPIIRIAVKKLDIFKPSQKWKIILNPQDKKLFKLQNVDKKIYLYVSQEPREGKVELTYIDIDNDNYKNDPAFYNLKQEELDNRTNFSFITSFGTHLNIIDENK